MVSRKYTAVAAATVIALFLGLTAIKRRTPKVNIPASSPNSIQSEPNDANTVSALEKDINDYLETSRKYIAGLEQPFTLYDVYLKKGEEKTLTFQSHSFPDKNITKKLKYRGVEYNKGEGYLIWLENNLPRREHLKYFIGGHLLVGNQSMSTFADVRCEVKVIGYLPYKGDPYGLLRVGVVSRGDLKDGSALRLPDPNGLRPNPNISQF